MPCTAVGASCRGRYGKLSFALVPRWPFIDVLAPISKIFTVKVKLSTTQLYRIAGSKQRAEGGIQSKKGTATLPS